jgi:hypothetical protein
MRQYTCSICDHEKTTGLLLNTLSCITPVSVTYAMGLRSSAISTSSGPTPITTGTTATTAVVAAWPALMAESVRSSGNTRGSHQP